MNAYYPHVHAVHLAAVGLSVSLFFARGLLLSVFEQAWVMAAPLRRLSYAIDTVLLAAGVGLILIVREYPGVSPWLTAKLALVAAYIVLGSFALKRGRTRLIRTMCWLAALATIAFVYGIASTHSPLGVASYWLHG